MKKLGLVTFSNTYDNYGQMLQTLATIEFFKHRGYEVYLLRQRLPFIKLLKRKAHRVLKALGIERKTDFDKWRKATMAELEQHPREFETFRKKHFNLLEIKSQDVAKQHFELVVAGSDQIWATLDEFMFMNFGSDVPRISIAPGVGLQNYNAEQLSKIWGYLQGYRFITVREETGRAMCRKMGLEANVILDPTFLCDTSCYDQYAEEMHITEDYVLVYMLGAKAALELTDIYKFAKANNLSVKYVASQGRMDSYEKIYATLPQWLYLLKHARYVITNSFHGMALSIIYRKQFLSLPIISSTKAMNDRIEHLAEVFDLKKRLYDGDMNVLLEPLDCEKIDIAIDKNKQFVEHLLETNGF